MMLSRNKSKVIAAAATAAVVLGLVVYASMPSKSDKKKSNKKSKSRRGKGASGVERESAVGKEQSSATRDATSSASDGSASPSTSTSASASASASSSGSGSAAVMVKVEAVPSKGASPAAGAGGGASGGAGAGAGGSGSGNAVGGASGASSTKGSTVSVSAVLPSSPEASSPLRAVGASSGASSGGGGTERTPSYDQHTPLATLVEGLEASRSQDVLGLLEALGVVVSHTADTRLRDSLLSLGVVEKLCKLLLARSAAIQAHSCLALTNFAGSTAGHAAVVEAQGPRRVVTLLAPSYDPSRQMLVTAALRLAKNITMLDAGSKALVEWGGVTVLVDIAVCPDPVLAANAVQVLLNLSCYGPATTFIALQWTTFLRFVATDAAKDDIPISFEILEKAGRITHKLAQSSWTIDLDAVKPVSGIIMSLMDDKECEHFIGDENLRVPALQAFIAAIEQMQSSGGSAVQKEITDVVTRVRDVARGQMSATSKSSAAGTTSATAAGGSPHSSPRAPSGGRHVSSIAYPGQSQA